MGYYITKSNECPVCKNDVIIIDDIEQVYFCAGCKLRTHLGNSVETEHPDLFELSNQETESNEKDNMKWIINPTKEFVEKAQKEFDKNKEWARKVSRISEESKNLNTNVF